MTTSDEPDPAALTREVSQRHLGEDWEVPEALDFFRAAKVVASADGLSAAEAGALDEVLVRMGVPDFFRQEVRDFDVDTIDLEQALRGTEPGSRYAKTMLAFVVNVASVDGFETEERETAVRMAKQLGLPAELVDVLAASSRIQHMASHPTTPDELLEASLALQRALLAYPR